MVIFGHSYLFVTISRATDAQSSPRRKAGMVFSLGWFENRADMAQTERMRTGGKAPVLHSWSDTHLNVNYKKFGNKTHLSFLI